MLEMDCCNYLQYKHSYYRPPFYDNGFYNRDYYYGHPYQNYYSSYYPHQWPNPASISDYVYNPKEARIRKAMREASREQNLGTAPIPSPRGGRRTQSWPANPEEKLMMTPSPELGSQICSNPIFLGHASNVGQFMPSMDAYTKLVHVLPPNGWLQDSPTYIQHNPMVELQQHQAHMWHQYQEPVRPCEESPYLLEAQQSIYQDSGNNDALVHKKCKSEINTITNNRKPDESTSAKSNNENSAKQEKIDQAQREKPQILAESENIHRHGSFLNACDETVIVQNPFDRDDDMNLKKGTLSRPVCLQSENKESCNKNVNQQNASRQDCRHCKFKLNPELSSEDDPYFLYPLPQSLYQNSYNLDFFLDHRNSNLIYTDVGVIPMYDNDIDVDMFLNNISAVSSTNFNKRRTNK